MPSFRPAVCRLRVIAASDFYRSGRIPFHCFRAQPDFLPFKADIDLTGSLAGKKPLHLCKTDARRECLTDLPIAF
jgi:hypothetical protein